MLQSTVWFVKLWFKNFRLLLYLL